MFVFVQRQECNYKLGWFGLQIYRTTDMRLSSCCHGADQSCCQTDLFFRQLRQAAAEQSCCQTGQDLRQLDQLERSRIVSEVFLGSMDKLDTETGWGSVVLLADRSVTQVARHAGAETSWSRDKLEQTSLAVIPISFLGSLDRLEYRRIAARQVGFLGSQTG